MPVAIALGADTFKRFLAGAPGPGNGHKLNCKSRGMYDRASIATRTGHGALYPALGSADFNSQAYAYGSAMPAVAANINATGEAAYTNAVAARKRRLLPLHLQNCCHHRPTWPWGTATPPRPQQAPQLQPQAQPPQSVMRPWPARHCHRQPRRSGDGSWNSHHQGRRSISLRSPGADLRHPAAQGQQHHQPYARRWQQTFAVEVGRSFVAGMYLVATSSGAPANKMSGTVVSYDGSTGALVITVDAFAGAAT